MHEKPTQNHPAGAIQVKEVEGSGRKQRREGCQVAAFSVLSKCLRTAATRLLEVLLRFTSLLPFPFCRPIWGPLSFCSLPTWYFSGVSFDRCRANRGLFSPLSSLPIRSKRIKDESKDETTHRRITKGRLDIRNESYELK